MTVAAGWFAVFLAVGFAAWVTPRLEERIARRESAWELERSALERIHRRVNGELG